MAAGNIGSKQRSAPYKSMFIFEFLSMCACVCMWGRKKCMHAAGDAGSAEEGRCSALVSKPSSEIKWYKNLDTPRETRSSHFVFHARSGQLDFRPLRVWVIIPLSVLRLLHECQWKRWRKEWNNLPTDVALLSYPCKPGGKNTQRKSKWTRASIVAQQKTLNF